MTERDTVPSRSGWPVRHDFAMLRAVRTLSVLSLLCCACDGDDGGPPSRDVTLETSVDASGLSEEVSFEIPESTRSISVIVEGAPDVLYALGAFELGDSVDLVQLPDSAPGPAMTMSYQQEQIGQMPGLLFQSIRLGTYTHVYPYRPDQTVVAGSARLRVASNRPGSVRVRIVMPEDVPAATLPLNLYVISDTNADPNTPVFAGEVGRILGQAGITVRINGVERLTGTALERITDFNEPQESPTSQSAMLPGLVADRVADGLDVFFVEGLPTGVAGLSLGTPGPPTRGSYYFGVLIRGDIPAVELARVTAHEVAHFVALQHVQNRGVSGKTYPDPLDDTTPGANNLMENGTVLTAGQAFALSRSALLVPQ